MNVALYLRLSREDEAHESESESIKNQRDFLTAYVEEHAWSVACEYVDDGYSGTNFERPAFLRMLADIEAGKIQLVLTKDLSRLGRDYIETGHFLERYFPLHRVRYIAVNDGIDTAAPDSQANALSPFTSVMNDFYARDISRKVRTALSVKRQRGQFIGSSAPYGYQKDPADPHHLILDEETAPIVRQIFQLYLSGIGLLGIANHLTASQIPTPSQHKQLSHTQKRFQGVWNDSILRRILQNPSYVGTLTQNRSRTISYKVNKRVRIPPEDWVLVEGTHEAIIAREQFQAVQRLIQSKCLIRAGYGGHLLSGLVFCADCNAPMTFSSSHGRVYLRCRTAKQHASLQLCSNHSIREDVVERQVCLSLQHMAASLEESLLASWVQNHPSTDRLAKQALSLTQNMKSLDSVLLQLYKDKASGLVTEAAYRSLQEQLLAERASYQQELEQTTGSAAAFSTAEKRAKLQTILRFEAIDRSVLLQLVERIRIHADKSMDIFFAFAQPNISPVLPPASC